MPHTLSVSDVVPSEMFDSILPILQPRTEKVMSPERHQRAVEILETKTGLKYSDDVEHTREWADALAVADDEGVDAAPLIVNIELPGFAPQGIREPYEVKRGMAFPGEYVLLGNKREQVRMAGNAVTPNAARDLIAACVESLGYTVRRYFDLVA